MNLNYLDFDYSEDADGVGTFDAMASVSSAQIPALHAEISAMLAWAHQHFPDVRGPSEDGGEWQYDLQGAQEVRTPLVLTFDESAGQLHAAAGSPSPPRTTITLTVSGNAAFCDALRDAFAVE
ncbi:hypothetical protein ASE52_08870 [Acidovorax sp. Root275]|uniref:hypothetical protein n=1 Tax=Acidovorax sp. Root275 TaxID=1736508 RepID=UPI00070A92BD|nr:hypothetical protein [Acidovorax sp. Root275]KRD50312.1 hypothetical protein ASE52_08870 [Acidovorax sp. Root275]